MPPNSIIQQVLAIAREAHLDLGGIEYLVNDRDGHVYFYDVNALSNFVTGAEQIVGFNPYERLVDFITAELIRVGTPVVGERVGLRAGMG